MQPTVAPTTPPDASGRPWPRWAERLGSAFLLYHLATLLTGSLAARPCSEAQMYAFRPFKAYGDLVNQGYGYRYYAKLDTTIDAHDPRPWSTPVVFAEMEFDEGGGPPRRETFRLPAATPLSPRLRHQRQLDLAYHLAADPRWAASYARHLCKERGCTRVTLFAADHRIPDLAQVRAALAGPAPAVDLEGDSTYGPRTKLGEFRCTDF